TKKTKIQAGNSNGIRPDAGEIPKKIPSLTPLPFVQFREAILPKSRFLVSCFPSVQFRPNPRDSRVKMAGDPPRPSLLRKYSASRQVGRATKSVPLTDLRGDFF